MDIPVGFLAKLWSFLSFLPFFFLLLILGIVKASIISPIVVVIILVGNSSVLLGLWPAHFLWTYYCLMKTKRLGPVLKILILLTLPIPLLLWPIIGIIGSLLVGIGYGIFAPLIATFEAVGEHVVNKLVHCFVDGSWSTIKGSCTVVRDFTDICFHSYFSYMDELSEKVPEDEKPLDIKLSKLPSCLLVSLLALPIDVPMITILAIWKSPCMLIKGWQRMFQDLIGRKGPFLETVCVPFAGLAIILWPLAVVGAVLSAFFSSFFLGLYGGVIVHQENSLCLGLAYIVTVISMFDEYTNDLLYLREGSCFPRRASVFIKWDWFYYIANHSDSEISCFCLVIGCLFTVLMTARFIYRRKQSIERKQSIQTEKKELTGKVVPHNKKSVPEQSRTLKKAIQQLKPMQLWDWLFRSCELSGRILLQDGLIDVGDIKECILSGKCNKLTIKLPAYCILQCLLRSAKSDSPGLLITDEVELTRFNWPKGRVFEWFLSPLLIMKEQIKQLQLDENEEDCLCQFIMTSKNEQPEDWSDGRFPSDNNVRTAQLQAIFRRLQGIVASMSRMPTFRRRFTNLVKVLYLEAIETGTISQEEGSSKSKGKKSRSINHVSIQNLESGLQSESKSNGSIHSSTKENDQTAEDIVEVRTLDGVNIV